MRVESQTVEAVSVLEAKALDPIFVVMQDHGDGKGRVILECYGLAWSAYWGAMGQRTLKQFFTSCEADYIANRMWPAKQRRTKADYGYLVRIVTAVQKAFLAA